MTFRPSFLPSPKCGARNGQSVCDLPDNHHVLMSPYDLNLYGVVNPYQHKDTESDVVWFDSPDWSQFSPDDKKRIAGGIDSNGGVKFK